MYIVRRGSSSRIYHGKTKFLRKRLRQNTQRNRKNKKYYVANDVEKKTASREGGCELQGQVQ